jgi:hypothetical protein
MTSILSTALRLVIPVAVVLGVPGEARAQIVIAFAPPAAYIATSQPEYFAGRPVYWYHNAWYYRDHNRWHYYRHEPVYLRERRAHWALSAHRDYRGPSRDSRPDPRRDDRGEHHGGDWNARYHYQR